jgi:type II secretory pathway pseudopilin PulG
MSGRLLIGSSRRLSAGFTLRKFIVVVSIVVLLGLMFLPSFMRARFGENENSAKGSLRTLYEANELYRKTHRPAEYPEELRALIETEPPLVDSNFVAAEQKGYRFQYERTSGKQFQMIAEPLYKFVTGYHRFYVDQTGIIRFNNATGDPIDA